MIESDWCPIQGEQKWAEVGARTAADYVQVRRLVVQGKVFGPWARAKLATVEC